MREVSSKIISLLIQIADESPEKIALLSENKTLTYKKLLANVYDLADWLQQSRKKSAAVCVENSFEWVIIDLACIVAGVTHIALPEFFSNQQLKHAINTARPDIIISDQINRLFEIGLKFSSCRKVSDLNVLSLTHNDGNIFNYPNNSKVTFPSGSISSPQGVCLSRNLIDRVTLGLKDRLQDLSINQHMCVLPLSTLLENISGVYVPLILGSSVYITPLNNIGFNGGSAVDPNQFIKKLKDIKPDSLILLPKLLSILVADTEKTKTLSFEPEFLAVIGSTISPSIINAARTLGWSVYAGYTVFENGMFISINVPGMDRIGSVGKPLPHVKVEIINDEICLSGLHSCAYLDEVETNDDYFRTGDLGYLDDDGYLYVSDHK